MTRCWIGCGLLLLCASARGERAGASDPVIARIATLLAASGWTLRTGPELVLERKQPVWVLAANLVNAPASIETEVERAARIRKHGRQLRPKMVFRMEPRWTTKRIAAARGRNAALDQRIAALEAKHGVAHLLRAALHRKHSDPSHGASAEERRRLGAYRTERGTLEARRVRLPDFQTSSKSLFFLRHEGWSDAHHLVDPPAAAEECYRLDRKVRESLLPLE